VPHARTAMKDNKRLSVTNRPIEVRHTIDRDVPLRGDTIGTVF